MAKRFTRLLAALALLVFMAPSMVTWGQTRAEVVTYTLDGTQTGGSNGYATESEITQNDITWMVTANTDINPWRFGGKSLNGVDRPMYSTSQIAGNITKFVVTNGTTNLTVNSMTLIVSDNANFTNPTSTVTGTWAASSTTTFERPAGDDWTNKYYKLVYNLTNTSTSNKYAQFVKAELYLQEGGNPTCATPTFNPAAGTYTEAQSVSISCATEGATVYYTTNGQDPTTNSTVYSGAINVSTNTTIKAMAVKSGFDNSAVASATYNFVTPMTIAEVRAQETGDVVTTGTVTSCVGTTGYIQDATAAICVYGTSLTVGDNITVLGTLSTYNGLLEITSPQVTVISSGNTINPETMTVAQAVASTNQGWYIRIEEATVTAISDKNVTIAQGDANVVVRFANTSDITFEVNDIISLNGNIGAFNGVQIANPQNVTVQENTNPIISAENVSIAFDATGGNIDFTIDNPVSGGVTSATTNDEWLTLGTVGSATVPFTCTANTATTARTATVVLTYTYNRATVTKEVTVTQAGYEAPHVTWDLSIASYASASEQQVTWTSNYATMVVDKASASTNANNYLGGNQTSTRFYKNSELTLSPAAGYAITSVVFTATTSGYAAALQSSTWTNATASVDGTTVTVTPTTDGANDMVAVIGGTCGFTSVTVYYEVNNAPSITANNVEITYDTDADEIEYVINNAVSGGSLVASTDSDWLEVDSDPMSGNAGTIEFTCSVNTTANTRTAIVTLTYTYNRAIVIKEVTVTQAGNPNAMMTIAEVRAQETGDVVTTGTVTSCVGTTGYIQDATAAICVYGTSLTVGNEIRVSGTLSTYHGLLEITNPVVTVISQGNTVTPELMTIADAVASTNQGWYIRIEDATVTEIDGQNTTIAQGENTIVVRGISGVEYGVNDIISLDGNIGAHDGVQIANPQNIEVQAVPSITITPDSFELDANSHMAEVLTAITYKNIVVEQGSGVDSFEVQYYDAENHEIESTWCTVGAVANETGFDLAIFAGPNEGGEARTVYFRLYAHDEEANVVYSNLVTVTQAALVIDYAVLPFIWEGGPKADFLALNGVTAYGLGSDYAAGNAPYYIKFDGDGDYIQVKCDQQPGKVTIGVKMIGGGETSTITIQGSADGQTFTDIEVLTISGAQGDELTLETTNVFAAADRYVRMLFTKGSNVGVGPITIEKGNASSITVTPATLDLEAVGTMTGGSQMQQLSVTYHNLDIESYNVFTVQFYDAQGEEQTQPDWIFNSVYVSGGGDLGYMVLLMISENDGPARSAYFKVYASDAESNVVYSNLVTINQAAAVVPPTPGTWVLTDLADLTEDDVFVIVGTRTDETYGGDYAMSNDNGTSNPPAAVAVTVVEGTLSAEPAANLQWNISITEDGYTFYPNGETETWLYCTNSNNGVRVGTNTNNVFVLDNESGYLKNVATSRYIGIYNSQDWRCYTSEGGNIAGQSFAFYKKMESGTLVTQTLSLSEGENWVSFNVKTTLDDLKDALLNALGDDATGIKITSQGSGYIDLDGSTWRGALNPFDVSQMFVIEVTGACEISLEAMPVNPARPITIVNGTNWIGFPFSESMSLSNAFSGFAVTGDKILAPNGSFATYNGDNWEGELMELLPGQGYKYEVTTTGERILVFPSSK